VSKVIREEIVMYSDYNERIRRLRNPRRIEDLWVQQGKFTQGKEVVAISMIASMITACLGQREERMLTCLQSVVGDVVA
jgi:hypothetical protein